MGRRKFIFDSRRCFTKILRLLRRPVPDRLIQIQQCQSLTMAATWIRYYKTLVVAAETNRVELLGSAMGVHVTSLV